MLYLRCRSSATLARYDGSAWTGITAIEYPDGSPFAFHLLRGTAGSTTNVWAVGWGDSADDQVIYRFDGSKWTKMTTPILPVRDIWATGTNELWTADAGGYVSHWDGAAWHDLHVGTADVHGIYGFTNTDVWVTAETVLQYNGTTWTDKGAAGGDSIWGATSGDMWTGAGYHLVSGVWQQKTGAGSGFKKVIGASASDLFFLGTGQFPYSYYQNNGFHPADLFPGGDDVFDVWPLSPTDYWVVGKRQGNNQTIFHSVPSGTPGSVASPAWPSAPPDPEPLYKTIGKVLLKKDGADYVPFKSFDDVIPEDGLVWNDSKVWVRSAGLIWVYSGGAWTTIASSCGGGGTLQVDGDGHLWVGPVDVVGSAVCVYVGSSWMNLGNPVGIGNANNFAVRDHDAWLFAEQASYRYNGSGWDSYATGLDPELAAGAGKLASDGHVYAAGSKLILLP